MKLLKSAVIIPIKHIGISVYSVFANNINLLLYVSILLILPLKSQIRVKTACFGKENSVKFLLWLLSKINVIRLILVMR